MYLVPIKIRFTFWPPCTYILLVEGQSAARVTGESAEGQIVAGDGVMALLLLLHRVKL